MKVLAEKRQQVILDLLQQDGVVKLQDICNRTTSSESSIRRDLQVLEDQGRLVRIHGGAKVKQSLQRELDMVGKSTQNISDKQEIAQYVASLIQDDDVLYLDAGTTTLALIPFLKQKHRLTVVTNGVEHAACLADLNIRTFLLGGQLKNTTKAIVGVEAVRNLANFRFNKAFLGINGIHEKYGLTTPDPEEAEVKRTAIDRSEQSYVLADASKFNCVSFTKVAATNVVTIITNQLPDNIKSHFGSNTKIQEVSL